MTYRNRKERKRRSGNGRHTKLTETVINGHSNTVFPGNDEWTGLESDLVKNTRTIYKQDIVRKIAYQVYPTGVPGDNYRTSETV